MVQLDGKQLPAETAVEQQLLLLAMLLLRWLLQEEVAIPVGCGKPGCMNMKGQAE